MSVRPSADSSTIWADQRFALVDTTHPANPTSTTMASATFTSPMTETNNHWTSVIAPNAASAPMTSTAEMGGR